VVKWNSAAANAAGARQFCREAHAQVYLSRWFDSICSPPKPDFTRPASVKSYSNSPTRSSDPAGFSRNTYSCPNRLRVSSALGFPSKTSAEIAPDHRESSKMLFGPIGKDSAQPRINIALCKDWWCFPAALGNGGNRFPLPAPHVPPCKMTAW
jgi:hypothetical protein